MHFNLEVNYLLDPAHLEIRVSCEKKAKPKKLFLEEAHCFRISDANFQNFFLEGGHLSIVF